MTKKQREIRDNGQTEIVPVIKKIEKPLVSKRKECSTDLQIHCIKTSMQRIDVLISFLWISLRGPETGHWSPLFQDTTSFDKGM